MKYLSDKQYEPSISLSLEIMFGIPDTCMDESNETVVHIELVYVIIYFSDMHIYFECFYFFLLMKMCCIVSKR